MKDILHFIGKYRRPLVYLIVGLAHAILLLFFRINMKSNYQEVEPGAQVMKLVDVEEYIPPPPPPEEPEEILEVSDQPDASEEIVEVEKEVISTEDGISTDQVLSHLEPNYLPQHQISQIPEIPSDVILERIEYPPIAYRQGLEAVVYLELFIDQYGEIRRVEILRDPGNGFGEAAIEALRGIRCRPAEADGETVAVRFRYPIRFTLNS